jgi:hypothetical protein
MARKSGGGRRFPSRGRAVCPVQALIIASGADVEYAAEHPHWLSSRNLLGELIKANE